MTISKNPVMIKLAELSCQVDSDQHRGFRQCDECGDGIDDEQTFYFWSEETTDKTFCHPSCVILHYLIRWFLYDDVIDDLEPGVGKIIKKQKSDSTGKDYSPSSRTTRYRTLRKKIKSRRKSQKRTDRFYVGKNK